MKGFTLVELMVVVLITAILAAAAVPLYQGRVDAAKWSEGKAIMGTLSTALRCYVASVDDTYAPVPTLNDLGIGSMGGRYFSWDESGAGDFSWVINNNQPLDFLITATAPPDVTSPSQMTLNANGQWTIIP